MSRSSSSCPPPRTHPYLICKTAQKYSGMIQNKDLQCHKFILAVSAFFYPRKIKDSRSGNKKKSYHGIDWDFENALSQQLWMACNYLINQRPRDLLFTLSGQAQLYLPQIISCQRHKKISFEEIFFF